MAVTAAVRIGWRIALAITRTSDVVAGEFAHQFLSVVTAFIVVVVMASAAVGTVIANRVLVVGYSQMQMNSERRRQRRQDRHCQQQMAKA